MMKLGFFLYRTPGTTSRPGAIRACRPDANQSLRHYIDITQTAERALFDFVFNADSNSTFGPDDPEIWKRNTDRDAARAADPARRAGGGDEPHRT